MKRTLRYTALLALLALLIGVPLYKYFYNVDYQPVRLNESVLDKTFNNYGMQAIEASIKHDLPADYLLSLIVLESSGRKIVPQRFERHVYNKLKKVQQGQLAKYEGVTSKDLANRSDAELKRLASSWGPFQIMGYKSFEIGVDVSELQGNTAIQHGCTWINKNYGTVLREERYQDAFHIHNTGKPYPKLGPPKTYNPDYVAKGISQMTTFAQLVDSVKSSM